MLPFLFTHTPLKFYIQSIWRDEAFSYLLAKQNIVQILITTAKDSNPPLYYLALHIWMIFFGHSEFALRTFSFLFFIAALYVAGLFLIEIFKIPMKRSLLFLLLFVLSPLLHYYAFEARMYSMFAFITALSFYYLYKEDYKKYSVTLLIALYTHYFAFFALLGQIIYLFLTGGAGRLKSNIKMFAQVGVFYVPWIAVVLFSRPPVTQGFWIARMDLKTFFDIPAMLFTGYEQYQSFSYSILPFIALFLYGLLACYFFAIYLKNRRHSHPTRAHHPQTRRIGLLLFCWTVPPLMSVLLISFFRPIFLPRYTIFISVGFLLALIYIINSFKPRLTYLLFALLIATSLHYSAYQVAGRNKQNMRKPLLEIRKLLKPDDVVLVTHEFNFHPAQYYINTQQVYLYGKPYETVPWYVGKVLIPEDKMTKSLPIYPRKAFVLRQDGIYSIQAIY